MGQNITHMENNLGFHYELWQVHEGIAPKFAHMLVKIQFWSSMKT